MHDGLVTGDFPNYSGELKSEKNNNYHRPKSQAEHLSHPSMKTSKMEVLKRYQSVNFLYLRKEVRIIPGAGVSILLKTTSFPFLIENQKYIHEERKFNCNPSLGRDYVHLCLKYLK